MVKNINLQLSSRVSIRYCIFTIAILCFCFMYFCIDIGSSDGTLQIVDMRVNNHKKAQMKIKAHTRDVNVCDWNKVATHLIVTGSDDACVKVWDLRLINEGA